MKVLSRTARVLPLIGAMMLQTGSALADTPRVYTNQQYVEDSMAKLPFDIGDVKSVFRMVLSSLPNEVTVYPTENYYYFWFNHDGIKYRRQSPLRYRGP